MAKKKCASKEHSCCKAIGWSWYSSGSVISTGMMSFDGMGTGTPLTIHDYAMYHHMRSLDMLFSS